MNIFEVSHLFVMRFATIGLAEIFNPLSIFVGDDHILVGMGLFLPL